MADETITGQETTTPPAEPVAEPSLLTGENTNTQEPLLTGEVQTEEDAKPESLVPEKYEWTSPEGYELDEAAIGELEPLARELGLDNARANALATKLVAMRDKMILASDQARLDQIQEWVNQSHADKDIKANVDAGNRAFARLASPGLKTFLKVSGLVNHPEVIRHFISLDRAMAEDTHVSGGPQNAPKSKAEIMFPSMSQSA